MNTHTHTHTANRPYWWKYAFFLLLLSFNLYFFIIIILQIKFNCFAYRIIFFCTHKTDKNICSFADFFSFLYNSILNNENNNERKTKHIFFSLSVYCWFVVVDTHATHSFDLYRNWNIMNLRFIGREYFSCFILFHLQQNRKSEKSEKKKIKKL